MNTFKISLILGTTLFGSAAFANLKIVTTTADLASIAQAIGGNKILMQNVGTAPLGLSQD